jgi:AraC-like DNA-binding protein/mannose-6-phosphate isomerase-like protein (cupin superfamily)
MEHLKPIGCATEFIGLKQRPQLCYGTFRRDMPDPAFRFNIIFVQHAADFKMHSHEYAELVIVLSGRGIHLTDQGHYPLEEGDVFVISGNHRHGFKDPKDLRLCNIMFDPAQSLAYNRDLKRMLGYPALFEPASPLPGHGGERLHLSTDEMVYVTSIISTLKSEFDGKAEGRQSIVKNLFQVMAVYLCRLYADHKGHTAPPLIRMTRVAAHIQEHFRTALSIDDLARMAHLSRSQFQRTFKRAYHITPLQYILKLRLHEACEMLKDPNLDITNIAFDVGFSSSSFFATQFKQYMGEPPSEYRRKKLAEARLQPPLAVYQPASAPTALRPAPAARAGGGPGISLRACRFLLYLLPYCHVSVV